MLYFARWKIITICLVLMLGFLANLPNFLSPDTLERLPSFFLRNQIVLGLDLQGGAYLLYEVDEADYSAKRFKTLVGDIRRILRERPRIGYTGLSATDEGARLRIRDPAMVEEARARLEELTAPLTTSVFGTPGISEYEMSVDPDGLIVFRATQEGTAERLRGIVQQSIEVIRRRIDEFGTTEPNIQRQGTRRILVEAPGADNPQQLKAVIGTTARLTFHMVDLSTSVQDALVRPPPGSRILPAYGGGQSYLVEDVPLLSGDDLVDAQAALDSRNNQPVVNFRLNTSGARKFAVITAENVNRPFAIVLDDEVVSAPVIREPIPGGVSQISGSFTLETANDLAVLLRAGALPAKLTVVEERVTGPGLGQDSIDAGRIAAIVGAIAVVIFMILAYGRFGVIADLSLFANIVLIFGVLTALQATLTLPGIAGIVLTIGMAVDANVLIFERIREELRAGRSPINAIDAGYRRALGTILDANITTLVAALVLFSLGSGPIRGFAVTLAIGIFTTVFSAFTVSRLLVALLVRYRRPRQLEI